MAETKPRDDQDIGHSSTTAPGGEKEMTKSPGRTPGKTGDDKQATDDSSRRKQD